MYFINHKSIKAIAREFNISKNTVKKIIRSNKTKFEMIKTSKARPILGQHLETLNKLLEDNSKEPVRRRMTAKRLYEELQKSGYLGSYESVNLVVREFKREYEAKGRQVFIPLRYAPAEAFQFDWGEEEICLKSEVIRVKAVHVKLCYSRYSFVKIYPNEKLEMVLDAHTSAFQFFDGICRKGIYDNMKTAVSKILRGKERVYNEQFLQMASHYLFEPIACNPAAGWEKGRVEKDVLDTRRNFFTPIMTGDSYEEINIQLKEKCLGRGKNSRHPDFPERSIYEVYEEEKEHFIKYQGEFTSYKLYPTLVSPSSLVQYDTNMYSVWCEYVGLAVQVKAYAWQIVILHKGKIIGEHKRCFKTYQKVYNPWHYVSALERKPGALRNGAPFIELMQQLPAIFSQIRAKLERVKNGDKEFISILNLVTKYGLEKITNACKLALEAGGCSSALVAQYLRQVDSEIPASQGRIPEYIQLKEPPDADCSIYSKRYLTIREEVCKI
jgi:transposase